MLGFLNLDLVIEFCSLNWVVISFLTELLPQALKLMTNYSFLLAYVIKHLTYKVAPKVNHIELF